MDTRPAPTEDELAEDRAQALALTPVSRETEARLQTLVDLLLQHSAQQNLISRTTLRTIWTRHVADSLQLLPLAPDAKSWIDLGSGAGFPGLVIACALADQPGAQVHLVESTGKKANFLRTAAGHIGVPATVHNVQIEDFVKNFRPTPDAVTARALAPLDRLLELAEPLLKKPSIGLFLKGQDVAAELTQAAKSWNIDHRLVPSKTSTESRIVVVQGLRRRPQKK